MQETSLGKSLLYETSNSAEYQEYTNAIINTVSVPVVILDKDLKIRFATDSFYKKFNTNAEEIFGEHFNNIKNCPGQNPAVTAQLKMLLIENSIMEEHELSCEFPTGKRYFRMNASPFRSKAEPLLIVPDLVE